MSRRQLKSDDVDGFLRAAWDELEDTSRHYGVTVVLDVRRSLRSRSFSFHAAATRVDEEGNLRPAGDARMDWPSEKYNSLHALLYRLAMALNHQVQIDYHERTGKYYSSPTDVAGK
jgi:hypothetical protein